MTRPDLDALAALIDKTSDLLALHHDELSALRAYVRELERERDQATDAVRRHMAGESWDKIVAAHTIANALPALLAYVRELESRGKRRDLGGGTHWDIAEVGAVCHDECAVAQIKAASLAMRERCAQACEKVRDRSSGSATECAAAIRALEV